jgi:hypothetical protein
MANCVSQYLCYRCHPTAALSRQLFDVILVTVVTKWSQGTITRERNWRNRLNWMVARGGIEPPTRGFSVRLSVGYC